MKIAAGLLVCGFWTCGGVQAQDAAPTVAAAPKPAGWLLVLEKPYAGVQEYEHVQKASDGKVQTTHETDKLYRDSAGRIRKEIAREKEKVVWTYLTDPAAKVQYRWNNEQKIAYVTKLGDPVPARDATHPLEPGEVRDTGSTINGKRYRGTVSLLPEKTIEKFETTGSHLVLYSDVAHTVVYSTNDRWYQPEYHVTLQQTIDDQQYGHRAWHFKSFKAEEPKAELFQVPKGFTLKATETAESEQFE